MQFEHGYYILFMKNANSVHKNNTFLYIFTKPRLLNIVFLSLFPFIFLSKFKKYINFVVDVNICCTFQHYRNGDLVRIIEGDFKGIVGRVARVAGQQRVVVELDGICMVTTAYIPSAFIKKI